MGGESETKMGWVGYRASFPKESRPSAADRGKLPEQGTPAESAEPTEPGDGTPTTEEE